MLLVRATTLADEGSGMRTMAARNATADPIERNLATGPAQKRALVSLGYHHKTQVRQRTDQRAC
jgi:hypothetical protein